MAVPWSVWDNTHTHVFGSKLAVTSCQGWGIQLWSLRVVVPVRLGKNRPYHKVESRDHEIIMQHLSLPFASDLASDL